MRQRKEIEAAFGKLPPPRAKTFSPNGASKRSVKFPKG
jgi:hypothetical protein